jgi:predicted nucleic acid-binding protein
VLWAVIDTGVYIDHWQGRLPGEALERVRRAFIVRHSAVVLSELRRGARSPHARQLVESLARTVAIHWEPSAWDWWEAGRAIQRIGDARGWTVGKRRDFQNDTLIALTARRHGAAVVTTDREDFELLAGAVGIRVLAL